MNNRQKYDIALMEGVSPKRLAKKRMKAFIEAVSEVAPKALVEAVVNAHNALFEAYFGTLPSGIRFGTGLPSSGYSRGYGNKTIYNGNDLVRANSDSQPPTSANTLWVRQNPRGSFAPKHYEPVAMYDPAPRIDTRRPTPHVTFNPDDSWEEAKRKMAVATPPPQEELPAPQAVRQQAPQPAPQPKVECPPVCPEPAPAPAPEIKAAKESELPKAPEPKKEAPKKVATYKWKESDFKQIEGEGCSETHKYVINLVSYNKNNRGAAMSTARYLAQDEDIPGVYTYQFDGLAQNTTRPDVWRVRIGFFKSKAAARYFFRKYVFPHVGKQFNWWVGTCDGEKGDKMKPNTFALGKNIKENECVDTSSQKASSEQPASNASEKPAENTSTKKSAPEEKHVTMETFVTGA